ncbi:MAG: sulfatase-like hydrolase/transferase, partial [Verrucomicrobiae bacterium]|nr:sulfatase-like hydrolase/transferase [Verrucomicrobiae bacterium]
IIFTSDNGGLWPDATTNLPVRQGKGSIYEGGTRVPAILKFPGRIAPGSLSDEPVITIDFFPTILEVAGVPVPQMLANKMDGLSLVPLMKNARYGRLNREALFWHYPHYHMYGGIPYSAVRMGDWKLVQRHDGVLPELYHLSEDIHEDNNLALVEPFRTAAMLKRLKDWRTSVGAQMPSANPDYDPGQPTGWKRPDSFREQAATRF